MPYEIVIGDISNLSFHVDVIVTLAHKYETPVEYFRYAGAARNKS